MIMNLYLGVNDIEHTKKQKLSAIRKTERYCRKDPM